MNQNQTATSPGPDDPESWVDLYGDLLYRFARSRVKDTSIAEDLVQETFLAALKSRANFQGRSTALTWLISILKHKIVDHIRKRVREPASDKVESLSDAFANDPVEGNFKDGGGWLNRPAKSNQRADQTVNERFLSQPNSVVGDRRSPHGHQARPLDNKDRPAPGVVGHPVFISFNQPARSIFDFPLRHIRAGSFSGWMPRASIHA
jgi:RNA polymerase sigma factor (sigma-70 family)